MSDLIKRSDAIKDLCDISNNSDMPEDWHKGLSVAISALYRVSSADRPQGEWKWGNEKKTWHKCSVCGEQAYSYYDELADNVEELFDFCPNCGAKMKGADDAK